jgi:uncharacterized coiled-coil protein SlyX
LINVAVMQGKLEAAKTELQDLHKVLSTAQETVAHRERALKSAISQLRDLKRAAAAPTSPRDALPPPPAEASAAASQGSTKNKKKGRKAKSQGISNVTTSRSDAAKAADAALALQDELEAQVEEQRSTIAALQEKLTANVDLEPRFSGMFPRLSPRPHVCSCKHLYSSSNDLLCLLARYIALSTPFAIEGVDS